MYAKVVAPIVAVVFLAVQAIFGITVSEELQNEVVGAVSNAVAIGIVLYGVVTEGIKKKETK